MKSPKSVKHRRVVFITMFFILLACIAQQIGAQSSSDKQSSQPSNHQTTSNNRQRSQTSDSRLTDTNNLHTGGRRTNNTPQDPPQKTETENKPKYSNKPFDKESRRISRNFVGHDIIKLRNAIEKCVILKKEEYETTEEFEQRTHDNMINANKSIGYGTLKMGDYVAFPLNTESGPHPLPYEAVNHSRLIDLTYDADCRTLKVSFFSNNLLYSSSSLFIGLKGYLSGVIGISFKKDLKTDNIKRDLIITNVSPEYIKANKSYLTLCCVGQLYYCDHDLFTKDSFHGEMEKDDLLYYRSLLPLCDVQFWLYNVKTGEVLVKFTSHDLEIGASRTLGDTTLCDPSKIMSAGETWKTILAGKKRLESQSWEKKQPTIVIDTKTDNLAHTLQNAAKGSIVQIKKGTRINLGAVSKLANAIAITGETGDPQDAVIVITAGEYLTIQSSDVYFKGITFEVKPNEINNPLESMIRVDLSGDVLFIDCIFKGIRSSESIGVSIDEGNAKFWNCVFKDFGEAAIFAQNEGTSSVAYCEFSDNKIGVNVGKNGMINAAACFFSHNQIGYYALKGEGHLNSSLFNANKNAWNVTNSAVELDKESNVVSKYGNE